MAIRRIVRFAHMSDAEFDEHDQNSNFGLGPAETERATAGKSLEQACRHLGGVLPLLAAKGILES